MRRPASLGILLPSLAASFALGQATTDRSTAEVDLADLPAPAKQRVEADHDSWWQSAVFYEVFVRSFADSTEGPLAGDGVGDLRGLIERLDYLNDGDPDTDTDLGVTALWLMPIFESPSYHGYDTDDYYSIDREYGTNEDFKDLIAEAERRGIRVILDLVLNHCSDDHPWFQRAISGAQPYRSYFTFADELPDYEGPWGQRVWHPIDGRVKGRPGSHYYGVFSSHMPDLNYRNPIVTSLMQDVTRFWLEDMGAHGFRLDAIRHLIERGRVQENTPETHEWLERFHEFYKSVDPEAMTVGEVWSDSETVSRFTGGQMDLAFEFQTAYTITEAINAGDKTRLVRQLAVLDEQFPLGMYATFLRNHDQPRTRNELGGSIEKAKLAAAIQFSLPGVPFVYYGEEIGMLGTKPDERIRTPMQWEDSPTFGFTTGEPWSDANGDVENSNVAALESDPDSILSLYKTLVRNRLGSEVLRFGEVRVLESANPGVVAFQRIYEGQTAVCVFNLTDAPADGRVIWSMQQADRLPDLSRAVNLVTGEQAEIMMIQTRSLPPKSVAAVAEEIPPYGFVLLAAPLLPDAPAPQPMSKPATAPSR